MLETVFILFLAGCADDGQSCETLREAPVMAADLAACEEQLGAAMRNETALWPVYAGECRPAGDEFLVASRKD